MSVSVWGMTRAEIVRRRGRGISMNLVIDTARRLFYKKVRKIRGSEVWGGDFYPKFVPKISGFGTMIWSEKSNMFMAGDVMLDCLANKAVIYRNNL